MMKSTNESNSGLEPQRFFKVVPCGSTLQHKLWPTRAGRGPGCLKSFAPCHMDVQPLAVALLCFFKLAECEWLYTAYSHN
eukprot:6178361-Pleurochrysis_carterae.AAC.2